MAGENLGDPASDHPEGADHGHVIADLRLDPAGLVQLAQRLGYAGVPGMGNFQNDTVAVNDSVNVGFPLYIDFVLPANLVKLAALKLSFKLRAFRSYVNTSVSGSTGAGTSHAHTNPNTGAETGHTHSHSHSHGHTWHIANGLGGAASLFQITAGVIQDNLGVVGDVATTTDATASAVGSSGHIHGIANTGNEAAHTHPLTAAITFQIQESTQPAGITCLLDGIDITTALGGPWSTDQVELDLTSQLVAKPGYHEIRLTSTQLGRVMGYLRATSIVNPLAP